MDEIQSNEMNTSNTDSRTTLLAAWGATLLVSSLTLIFWRQVDTIEPLWWPWATGIALLAITALTFTVTHLNPIRSYLIILVFIFFLGFGGGWQSGLVPIIRGSDPWLSFVNNSSWAISALATHLLRLTIPTVILGYLLLRGNSLRSLFLTRGNPRAPVEPSKLIGMKRPEPWTKIGSIFAVIFSLGTATYIFLTARPSLDLLIRVFPLVPVAVVIAAMNSFNEEFTLRAAPLSQLVPVVGKKQALMLTTVFFGLGHFYGIPSGAVGVVLAGFLGWFLGKSMLETRGFAWAWLIHFVMDVFIFTSLAMASL